MNGLFPPQPPRMQLRLAAMRFATTLLAATGAPAWAQAEPEVHTVTMEGVRFSPARLEVKVGDIVIWENKDFFPHDVTAGNAAFQSGNLASNASWKLVPSTQGVFHYACTLHPGMSAVLVVD